MSKTVRDILKEYEQQKGMGKEPVILIDALKLIRDMYEDGSFPLNVADKAVEKIEDQPIGYDVDKLTYYEDLEEQGKLVLFPTYAYFIMNNEVHKGWVQEVVHSVCRKPLYNIRYDDNSLANYRGYLGLTVFLTEEEAIEQIVEEII